MIDANKDSSTVKLPGARLWIVLGISTVLLFYYILPFFALQQYAHVQNFQANDTDLQRVAVAASSNKLVCIVAVGRKESLQAVSHNIYRHFSGWDCIVFVWASEYDLSSNNSKEFQKIANMCTIKRHENMNWGDFLFKISPAMLKEKRYAYVAILLDDVWLPSKGNHVVLVPRLLARMAKNNIDVASPAVWGAHRDTTMPKKWPSNKCIMSVHYVEIFFTIYTVDMWLCLYNTLLDKNNSGGWCYDKCLKLKCGGTHGIDYTMVAQHLQAKPPFFSAGMVPHVGTDGNLALCKRYGCTSFIQKHDTPLECYF